MDRNRRQALLAWIFVSTLVILLVVLGILQYRWTGEVSVAERARIRATLEVALRRLSQNLNAEATAVASAITSDIPDADDKGLEAEYASRFEHLKAGSYAQWLKSVSIAAVDRDGHATLRRLDPKRKGFQAIEWPGDWQKIQKRMEEWGGPGSGPFGRNGGEPGALELPDVIEIPDFRRGGPGDGGPPRPPEVRLLLLEYDLDYLAGTVLPKLLELHLGASESQNYHAVAVQRGQPSKVLYRSDTERTGLTIKPDATVRLFEVRVEPSMRWRGGGGFPGGGPRMGGAPRPDFRREEFRALRRERENEGRPSGPPDYPAGFERGRWELSVQHRAGSLEVLVARARTRNLAVIGGIMALILGAGWVLLLFTRRVQRLAELQMQFVASVSHELRTPLTVMRTAGHNLQGKVATDTARVRQYGALIQQESQKLSAIVEQVLRFANSNAGRVINTREPVAPADLIQAALQGSRDVLDASGCALETTIAPDLPPVNVDRATVEHALQNLVANAAKYGQSGQWIGVSASLRANNGHSQVEIRVKDRGPGIPAAEIDHIFDPFYRGVRAIEDQIHGTGLGLTLSRRIIEAHGGTITASSDWGNGTEFTVLLPLGETEESHATHPIS